MQSARAMVAGLALALFVQNDARVIGSVPTATRSDTVATSGGQWDFVQSTAKLASPRRDLGGAVAGGRAYFAGGCSDTASPYECLSPTAAVDIVTPDGTVTAAAPLSVPRGWATGCGISKFVLFAGGGTGGAAPHLAVGDVIDTTTGKTTAFPTALSVGRWGLGCTAVNGSVFYAGGKSIPSEGTYAMSAAVDVFHPTSQVWERAPYVLSHPKECVAGAGSRNSVVWAGGWVETPNSGHGGPIFQRADTAIDTFTTQGTEGPHASFEKGAEWPGAVEGPDGNAYVLGSTELLVFNGTVLLSKTPAAVGAGVLAATVTNNGVSVGDRFVCFYSLTPNGVVCYDISKEQWMPLVPCSVVHKAGAFVAVGSTVLVAGGYNPDSGNAATDVVDLLTIS